MASKSKEGHCQPKFSGGYCFARFFDGLEFISSSEELVNRAIVRFNTGNPPGKDRKYGDAINWETLLESVPCGEDLCFISADKDYASIFDDKQFHPFWLKNGRKRNRLKLSSSNHWVSS